MTLLAGVPPPGCRAAGRVPSPTVGVWHLGPCRSGVCPVHPRRHRRRGLADAEAPRGPWAPQGRRHRHLRLGRALRHRRRAPLPPHHHAAAALRRRTATRGRPRHLRGRSRHLGAVALGAVGAWIGCRKNGVAFRDFVDAAAPGLAIAQAMGRFGNWFNNEIYGAPTDLPWRLRIYEWDTWSAAPSSTPRATPSSRATSTRPSSTRHSGACCSRPSSSGSAGARPLKAGQVFAAYVMGYPVGRIVIENMRSDSANLILGQRVNTWVSILVFLLGVCLWRRFGRMEQPAAPAGQADPDGAEVEQGRPEILRSRLPPTGQRHRCQRDGAPGAVVTRSARPLPGGEHDVSGFGIRRINR